MILLFFLFNFKYFNFLWTQTDQASSPLILTDALLLWPIEQLLIWTWLYDVLSVSHHTIVRWSIGVVLGWMHACFETGNKSPSADKWPKGLYLTLVNMLDLDTTLCTILYNHFNRIWTVGSLFLSHTQSTLGLVLCAPTYLIIVVFSSLLFSSFFEQVKDTSTSFPCIALTTPYHGEFSIKFYCTLNLHSSLKKDLFSAMYLKMF